VSEAPAWAFIMALFLVITAAVFFAALDIWTGESLLIQQAAQRHLDQLQTGIAIEAAGATSTNCGGYSGLYKARVTNSGTRSVSALASMDLLVDYTSATGVRVVDRLPYGTDWSVSGILPDTRDPDLWDPGETATLSFNPGAFISPTSGGTVVVVTPEGVPDSAYFACVPPKSTGFLSPTSQAADTGGDGDGFEVSPANAFADDASFASNVDGSGDQHRYYGYGITIPAGRTIFGIEVRLDWWLATTNDDNLLAVELSWDGGSSWTTAKSDLVESASERTVVLGSSGDTWGRTWSTDELANGNFLVRITAVSTGVQAFHLDWAAVNVYYEAQ